MWKVTLSKSETTWSIDVGVALEHCQLLVPNVGLKVDREEYSGAKRSFNKLSMSTFW